MTRLAKKPLKVPQGVKLETKNGQVLVQGAKGKLQVQLLKNITVDIEKDFVKVKREHDEIEDLRRHGTMVRLIENAMIGVSKGYDKSLVISGVGFRAELRDKILSIQLGFSHPVELPVPEGVTVKVTKATQLLIEGMNKQVVGQYAAEIRSSFKAEPYKGKGIRYADEVIRRKAGKSVAK
jgi:large subunit ribosomal protein L6